MAVNKSVTLVNLALLCYCCTVCFSQDQNTETDQDLTGHIEQLTSRLNDAIADINKLKKLSLTTLNMILNPEQGTCTQPGDLCDIRSDLASAVSGTNCRVLGRANRPALSCEQLQEACQLPSGVYYVQGGGRTFHKVFCDMDSFGGGWTRFGKGNMSSEWNFDDEDEQTTTLGIITDTEILKMSRLHFTEFQILTDVEFRLQADDSVNPSSLSVTFLPSLTSGEITIDGSADHTHLLFDAESDHIQCFPSGSGSTSHRCGHGGTPPIGSKSQQLFIRSAFFGPRAPGALIAPQHANQWFRNKYTWNGSYYYVLAK